MSVPPVSALRHVPAAALAVSEPPPYMFGNDANEPKSKTWTNDNWLKSRFHFSFAEYSDPRVTNFGVLRVLNDDLVQPKRGFGTHPHRDMEIATYIVRGALTHQDSIGSAETLERGSVQYMSAGTGVRHSEHNHDAQRDLRFIQMWLVPRRRGLRPNYGGYAGDAEARKDKFQHVLSDVEAPASTPVKVHQDANLYVAELSAGSSVSLDIDEVRQAYAVVLEGSDVAVRATGAVLGKPVVGAEPLDQAEKVANAHDAFEVYGGEKGTKLSFSAGPSGAHVLVMEMAQSPDGGRRDIP